MQNIDKKLLRIGFILEDDLVPFWVNEIIKTILISSHQVVKINLSRAQKEHPALPYKLFSFLDGAIMPGIPSGSSKMKAEFPEGTSTLHLNLMENELDEQGLDKIKESKLDIIINFGLNSFHNSIGSIPRLGVWSIDFGNDRLNHSYAGFWEWFYNEPVNSVSIIQHKKQGHTDDYLKAEVLTKTDLLSLSRNQTLIYSKAIDLVINTLSRLSAVNDFLSTENEHKSTLRNKPGHWHLFLAVFKLFYRLSAKALNKILYIEQWGLFSSKGQNFPSFNFDKFNPINPPKDRFWADPFVVSQDNKHFIFFEELPYKTWRGHLNCLILNAEGKTEDQQVILEKPYHLSYPFIFKYKDKWFMIPESAENRTIDLYECTEFPFKWKFIRTLLEGFRAYDSTLHFINDRVWLFCNIQQTEGGSPNDDLHLFSTDELMEGKWTPHPLNPILSDPYRARPAGRIFNYDGNWYRPSQVCVPRYGYGLTINRIIDLTESTYQEEQVETFSPEEKENLLALHTLNFTKEITMIDGIRRRFRFW